MKKIVIIISSIIVCTLLIVLGIVLYNKNLEKKRNNELEVAAKKYYELHMSNIKGLDAAEISLKMIKYVQENKNEEYKISSLKKCNENSLALLTLEDNNVKSIKITLNCK